MRRVLPLPSLLAALALAGALQLASGGARAADAKYPDWNGQWSRSNPGGQWDPSKPGGLRQQPPLTAEYQAIFEANVKAVVQGDEGYNAHARCFPAGMTRMMIAYEPLDIIVTPETTYIRDYFNDIHRIFTDGRSLTHAWTVTRDYDREHTPLWPEYLCAEDNPHIVIGQESYFRNADGNLMPTRKDQPPPDL